MKRPTREDGRVIRQPGPSPLERRGPGRPKMRSPKLIAAWQSVSSVDPVAVAAYRPTELDMAVGLALLRGARTLGELEEDTSLDRFHVEAILLDPVRMAWISTQVYSHLQQRAAMVDSSLYSRALAGDMAAVRLFYERMNLFTTGQKVSVQVSGGIDVRALSDEDLRRMVTDGAARLPPTLIESKPAVKVLDAEFTMKEAEPGG